MNDNKNAHDEILTDLLDIFGAGDTPVRISRTADGVTVIDASTQIQPIGDKPTDASTESTRKRENASREDWPLVSSEPSG